LTVGFSARVFRLTKSARRGSSLNQLIRDYLEELTGDRVAGNEFDRLRQLSNLARGRCGDWQFDPDKIHDRS